MSKPMVDSWDIDGMLFDCYSSVDENSDSMSKKAWHRGNFRDRMHSAEYGTLVLINPDLSIAPF